MNANSKERKHMHPVWRNSLFKTNERKMAQKSLDALQN